jgi:hypothetical protein
MTSDNSGTNSAVNLLAAACALLTMTRIHPREEIMEIPMNKLKIFALVAAVACGGGPALAGPIFPNGPAYGLASIASSETFLLKLFNGATDTTTSCTVRVDLINDAGTNLGTATRTIAPGAIAMLDQSSFITTTTTTSAKRTAATTSAAAASHISLRPQITFVPPTFFPPEPCLRIRPTFEIVDAVSLRTNRIAQPFPPGPILQVTPSVRFGFASTTSPDILRLNVVNTALSSQAGVCQVQAGFVDSLGNVSQSQTAALGPGQSLILNQAGGAVLRPVVRFEPPNPCLGILATVESVDAAADLTRFYYPPSPI